MTNKLIWSGESSTFHINSSDDFGYVNRHSGREIIDNGDGTFTCNETFDEFLPGFQGDIILFSEDEFFMGQVESTCEYYDYVAHFYHVIMVEQRESGDLEITINYHSLSGKAKMEVSE